MNVHDFSSVPQWRTSSECPVDSAKLHFTFVAANSFQTDSAASPYFDMFRASWDTLQRFFMLATFTLFLSIREWRMGRRELDSTIDFTWLEINSNQLSFDSNITYSTSELLDSTKLTSFWTWLDLVMHWLDQNRRY